MSVIDSVFRSLDSMGHWQLLLAFTGGISYAFAQGELLLGRGRRVAWSVAALSAAAFVFESRDWTHATMLLGFAIVGLGSFVGIVWLLCRLLGFGRPLAAADADWVSTAPVGLSNAPPRVPRHGEHAHSHF